MDRHFRDDIEHAHRRFDVLQVHVVIEMQVVHVLRNSGKKNPFAYEMRLNSYLVANQHVKHVVALFANPSSMKVTC